jgi:uncharacterized protein YceH (UPF0502 family)
MNIQLSAEEARVIGCLIEKSLTTPDQYPLSLNSLANACNQKSNREPLMELDERTVQQTVDSLVRKHLVLERSGFGSRVPKYQQRFCNTGFGSLSFTSQETAILCELLLRGPQTPGELRSRAGRMGELKEITDVELALNSLAKRTDGPFVVQLPREPGRREARFAHLLSGEIQVPEATSESEPREQRNGSQMDRIDRLEAAVAELRREVDELKRK